MKLADRYVPEDYGIPSNPLFVHLQGALADALRAPGDHDKMRETITDTKYVYELTDIECDFYEKLYVPSKSFPSEEADPYLRELLGETFTNHFRIGENERDLLMFLKVQSRLLAVVAPVGWGKTVLLKYVWWYLVNKCAILSSIVVPLYISVDQYEDRLAGLTSSRDIVNVLYELCLRPRLMRMGEPFSGLSNDEFWNFLMEISGDFSELRQKENGLRLIYQLDDDERNLRRSILYERMKATEKEVFPFCIGKFLAYKGRIPLLVFDNVDPLSIEVHKALLQKAVQLEEDYSFKVIISMRKVTYDELAADPNGIIATHPFLRVRLMPRNVAAYVEKRANAALRNASHMAFQYIDHKGIRITQSDSIAMLRAMTRILLNEECVRVLRHLSYNNLRRLNVLIFKYMATGYLEMDNVAWSMLERTVSEDEQTELLKNAYESPLWVVLSSLLTANYITRFSTRTTDPRVLQCAINMYCNGPYSVNANFIRLHIMQYLERLRRCTYEALCEDYLSVWAKTRRMRGGLQACIRHALRRYLQCNLIQSPERYRVYCDEDVEQLKIIELTEKGSYFRTVMASYYEYLVYMKDDVEIGSNPLGIKDCVRVRRRNDRYANVVLFLRWLFEREEALLRQLSKKRRRIYRRLFSRCEDEHPFMVSTATESMMAYGLERMGECQAVTELKAVIKKMNEGAQSFSEDL